MLPKKPSGASILCFHGDPSPVEAIPGFTEHHGRRVPLHQRTLPAPWIEELWMGSEKGGPAPGVEKDVSKI